MKGNDKGSSAAFGWFGGMPELPAHHHLEIAIAGSDAERWQLSGREDLSREVFDALVESSDEVIATSLALNYATPADLLLRLSQRHPDLKALAAVNPNAPTSLKETAPLGSHSQDSINRFLDAKDATVEERRNLTDLYEGCPHPGGPLLGSAWARVRPT